MSRLMMAVMVGVMVGSSAFAAPQSYPLVCRGGGGTLGLNGYNGLFYFAKSSQSAGAGLQPGQCSWIDRAIGVNEPTCLKQSNVTAAAWIFPSRLGQSYFSSTNAPWLRSLLNASSYQTFQVYNPGDGNCFVVTRLGP